MDKLKRYADNLQIENELQTCGNSYFYNVQPFYCKGMYITIRWNNDLETARQTADKLQKVKTYCKRYGYTIKRLNSPVGIEWYQVVKASDLEIMSFYDNYTQLSVSACEKVIHENHINPVMTERELNDKLKTIMDFYGNNLKAFFKSIAA